MQPDVIIVGTCHSYQAGGEGCSIEDAELLRLLLLNVCKDWSLRGIAEEMNGEWLVRYKSTQSVPYRVAMELGLPHLYCDPTTCERVSAGIVGRGEVRLEADLNGLSDGQRNNRLADEEIKREQFWLKKLQDKNIWPILFVCGASHVVRFRSLLEKNGRNTHILVEDWVPSNT